MTTAIRNLPRPGQCIAALVPHPIRRLLSWRVTLDANLVGDGTNHLTVQVGPSIPFRLLFANVTEGGEIFLELTRPTAKKLIIEWSATVPSDRVSQTLQKVAAEFKLGG